MAKRRASKKTTGTRALKRTSAKKAATKKASTASRKKSAKSARAKKAFPRLYEKAPPTPSEKRNKAAQKLGFKNAYEQRQEYKATAERKAKAHESYVRRRDAKRAQEAKARSPYEKRDAGAKARGYESYWDERQSRVRARKALFELGVMEPSVADVDELGTLGRGDSARELYYKTKRILKKYEPAPSDRQIWSLIRIFYKPRGRR